MSWLHSHGYEGETLDQVERAWYHGGTLPPKPIVITFDNGYPEQVTFAPPVQ
jgi:peptidoglycan/xylan/chitin deacetylase (PgdA/CDA1 family)